ncbi:PP2C family protein-serine/threonine phosphatase [Streptomyces meridianus]|uniref:SpoIIE family protein phosphatase n=1 Tax=Streptomyces meridianus TaxID=2938945 RepID=A0ABT0X5Z1_9ACTN|nr:SpoIIE family protein phosphatase [Streptomyces meridianus]MCM2577960.1 SpoIIE family protein phosphatase [Streptomyces meridianus]
MDPEIDYTAVFRALPGGVLLLTPELIIADASRAYLRLSGRSRDELTGRYLFDVFPDNPADPTASGRRNLEASLRRVMATGMRDTMALQRYDVEIPGRPGIFEERYWSPVNAPVLGPDGKVRMIVHRVEEVTAFIRDRGLGSGDDRHRMMEAELYARGRELQEVNERLRQAYARERQVALALQEAMLPTPRSIGRRRPAVRYRPAVGALNVCGDWYDLIDLPGERIAVAVGDVVGHGLSAAGVMGQLRSALSAAMRVADGPAQALDVLSLYARSVDGAESTVVAQSVVDWHTGMIAYSCSGHPPPALLHPDGTVQFLDQAVNPPLGAPPDHCPNCQATARFTEGATLVMYTDGLVERRDEDIDTGLARLAATLTGHRGADAETLADALLADLIPDGHVDDTALVVIEL